jgi:hypothetical protein
MWANLWRLSVLVVLTISVAASAAAQQAAAPDPIADDLAKAKEAYQTAVAKARDELLKAFASEEKKLLDSRLNVEEKVRRVEQVQNEKKAFETDGKLPTSVTLKIAGGRFQIAVAQAKLKCEKAFDTAADRYGRIDLAKAKAVLEEKSGFFEAAAPVTSATGGKVATTGSTPQAKARVPVPASPSTKSTETLERELAEWMLQHGGRLTIEASGSSREVRSIDQLPTNEFRITFLTLHGIDTEIPHERWIQIAALAKLGGIACYSRTLHPTVDDFAALSKSSSLGFLFLGVDVPGAAVGEVARLPKLVNIHLNDWAIVDADLLQLRAARSLQEIALPASITDEGLRILRTAVPGLSRLKVNLCDKITPNGLQGLTAQLEELAIGGHQVTPGFGAVLQQMRKLRILRVWPPEMTDQSFSALSALNVPAVDWGTFGYSKEAVARPEHIRSLLGIRGAKRINFSTQPIDDSDVPLFVNAAPGQTIGLYGTRLTSAGIAQIRQQLPQCKIETDVK